MNIGNRSFNHSGKTYIMGIVNITPDSFSDGGKWTEINAALHRVEQMLTEGADIIDIGGESTKPGYKMISAEEEKQRIIPVIDAIRHEFHNAVISVDTYKSEVARAALDKGADMINDIRGLSTDNSMAYVISEYKAACCIMHSSSTRLASLLSDITEGLKASIQRARNAGIDDTRIMIDPGVGFGKEYEGNLKLIANLEEFHGLGYPILIGASRKSVIGLALDLPVNERLEGTLAVTAVAVMKGCSFVRVHDIEENRRVIRMLEAIMQFSNKQV